MRRLLWCLVVFCGVSSVPALGSIFGQMQGVVHDPQHRPVHGARVRIQGVLLPDSGRVTETDENGGFAFTALSLGEYTVTVEETGFRTLEEGVTLRSNTSPVLHLQLEISTRGVEQTVTVTAQTGAENVDSVTPTTLVSRAEIGETPGADRANSLQSITDFVPGAYVTHDMLHMRGGHQVSWQIDGVEIPNTNIASNLGAQISPRDIGYMEIERGSYTADVGDRTYGVFNVVPKTGFDRDGDAELVLTAGNFLQTDDQLNFGSHSERAAWYVSLSGNRSDYGLAPPVAAVHHDATNGYGAFGSVIVNRTPRDQMRLVAQVREDFFQIPYDPDPNSFGNMQYDSSGLRDGQRESDALVDFTWAHTFSSGALMGTLMKGALLQVSPFYHRNRASYEPSLSFVDMPVATTADRSSNYGGLQASVTGQIARNTLSVGIYSFGQHDSNVFGAVFNDGSNPSLPALRTGTSGGVVEEFVSDNFKVTPWLTLIGGVRQTHFSGDFVENATSPRVGVAVELPRLHWVLRGFYGRYYQPPPLVTASGPVVEYAESQNTTFLPLRGERDEEHQFGVQAPFRGWLLDVDNFKTQAKNFLDHSNVGESSLYYPVTVDGALIRGWELTLRSPRLWRGGQGHLAYSNQVGEQRGAITGGLVCYPISSPACDAGFSYTPLDHDQRNTLAVGYSTGLAWRVRASTDVTYGSGFHNGSPDPNTPYPNEYLPAHTSVDLSLSRPVGERTTVSVTGLNLSGRRTLLDNSLTFGGFHFNDPRQVYGEVRFRFHL